MTISNSAFLEAQWKSFFPGSFLFGDVFPGIEGEARVGREQGVDLYLGEKWRELLPTGMVQVKSSPAEALKFLLEGFDRKQIIPVVIGPPPLDNKSQQLVLSRLATDYCWHPNWKFRGPEAIELGEFLRQLTELPEGFLLQKRQPPWVLNCG